MLWFYFFKLTKIITFFVVLWTGELYEHCSLKNSGMGLEEDNSLLHVEQCYRSCKFVIPELKEWML